MRRILVLSALGAMLAMGGPAFAKGKGKDAHPNLTAAHKDLEAAERKLKAAQVANEYDLDGHAAKAENLIKEALHEVGEAREAANKNAKAIDEKKEQEKEAGSK